jgi:hypothetical protein
MILMAPKKFNRGNLTIIFYPLECAITPVEIVKYCFVFVRTECLIRRETMPAVWHAHQTNATHLTLTQNVQDEVTTREDRCAGL